uniref:Uncharacterized protein n=1 Tax=Cacopsylla melanoneura TaxID=428564 RepID=A0A8D9ENC9_9HEMI
MATLYGGAAYSCQTYLLSSSDTSCLYQIVVGLWPRPSPFSLVNEPLVTVVPYAKDSQTTNTCITSRKTTKTCITSRKTAPHTPRKTASTRRHQESSKSSVPLPQQQERQSKFASGDQQRPKAIYSVNVKLMAKAVQQLKQIIIDKVRLQFNSN